MTIHPPYFLAWATAGAGLFALVVVLWALNVRQPPAWLEILTVLWFAAFFLLLVHGWWIGRAGDLLR